MNNTKYESTWLVTWIEDGVRWHETFDWKGMADDCFLEKKAEFGQATLDKLVPEGAKTLDMSKHFPDVYESWDMGDLIDDSCDWCGLPMPYNEAGHCCTACFLNMEARAGVM